MKTSKRLLSIFLAVVMVITTCSIGFTAFATDSNENQVFTYVNDDGEKVDISYAEIEEVIDKYAPTVINAVVEILTGVGIDVTDYGIDINKINEGGEPIYELLGQLAPLVDSALMSAAGIPTTPSGSTLNLTNPIDKLHYSYLSDENAVWDFLKLYAFCENNTDNSNDIISSFSNSALEILQPYTEEYVSQNKVLNDEITKAKNKIQSILGSAYMGGKVIDNTESPEKDKISGILSNMGMPMLPAGISSTKNVICDGNVSFKTSSGTVNPSTENITISEIPTVINEENGTSTDLRPFIEYVSGFARFMNAIDEDESLSLSDAIYYYYNLGLTNAGSSSVLAAYLYVSRGESLTLTLPYGKLTIKGNQFVLDALRENFPLEDFAKWFGTISSTPDIPVCDYLESFYLQTLSAQLSTVFASEVTGRSLANQQQFMDAVSTILVESGVYSDYETIDKESEAFEVTSEDFKILKERLITIENRKTTGNKQATLDEFRTGYSTYVGSILDGEDTSLANLDPVVKFYIYFSYNNATNGLTDSYLYKNYAAFRQSLANWDEEGELTDELKNFANDAKLYFHAYQLWTNFFSSSLTWDMKFDKLKYNTNTMAIDEIVGFNGYFKDRIESDYSWNTLLEKYPNIFNSKVFIEIANELLNTIIDKYQEIIMGAISSLIQSKVDVVSELKDIYKNLAEDPVGTIFDLLPILVIAVDEVVIPILFNADGVGNVGDANYVPKDAFYSSEGTLLDGVLQLLISDYSKNLKSENSPVGITSLSWDLNEVLPALLHWLNGDNSYTYTYYNTVETTGVDEEGNKTVVSVEYREPVTGAYGTKYDNKGNKTNRIPVILNIYSIDKSLANAAISDLSIADILLPITKIAQNVVDNYVKEHRYDVKDYTNYEGKVQPVNKGLNNVLVALPSLINDMGREFLKANNVQSDWGFGEFDYDEDNLRYNAPVAEFKYLVTTDEETGKTPASSEEIADAFATLFINRWATAIREFPLINDLLASIQNVKEMSWTFDQYSAKESNGFKYPKGVSAARADDAVDSLDALVRNIFPLLQNLGVLDQGSLSEVVSQLLFTNSTITSIATGVYGAIENAADGKFVFSPKQFAVYLKDSSYGTTFTSAANTLSRCSSWADVKNVNWGFTDGSAKAQQGFVNALAALCRPINDILAAFLAGGDVNIAEMVSGILGDLNLVFKGTSDTIQYNISIANSKLSITLLNTEDKNNKPGNVVIDLVPIINILSDVVIMGGNGYQSAIIPLLEALMCDNVKTYNQYINDYNKAKDNILIDILNPLMSFLNKVMEAPFDTLTSVLPNLAYFIDNNGISQVLNNLLSPFTDIFRVLDKYGFNVDEIIASVAGKSLAQIVQDALGVQLKGLNLKLTDLNSCNIQNYVIPIINSILKNNKINITIDNIDWGMLASLGTLNNVSSAAGGTTKQITANQGQVLVTVLRYIEGILIDNAASINKLLRGIDAISSNKTILNILDSVFSQIATANDDDIVLAVFYLLCGNPTNTFFDYRGFQYKDYEFSYPSTVDIDFLKNIAPMLDGLIGGLVTGGLNATVANLIYKDDIINSLATGLYGAIEKVKINDSMTLTELLAETGIDFSTSNVADLLVDKDYGQTYESAAKVIRNAGSWSKVDASKLSWGVTDRDSFVHALCAVLRPIYGVLDVLLNDGSLGLFNLIYLPGSDGYTSSIVPLMEAFGLYNIKTQYQYREDMSKEYDAILLDIINPLLDKVEDILNAPIQTVADMLPNLALFFANDGLLQLIENLLTPINALLDAMSPVADINDILSAVGLDISKELRKLGLVGSGYKFDIYDLAGSLKPLIGSDNIVALLNKVLGLIKINGAPLGIELMPIDWYQLASHGEVITNEPSQAATFGGRVYVKSDPNEVLIAVLRYLIETINYKDNYSVISSLIGGLIGGASDSVSGVIDQVLGMLTGDTDEVISELCGLLQTLA